MTLVESVEQVLPDVRELVAEEIVVTVVQKVDNCSGRHLFQVARVDFAVIMKLIMNRNTSVSMSFSRHTSSMYLLLETERNSESAEDGQNVVIFLDKVYNALSFPVNCLTSFITAQS